MAAYKERMIYIGCPEDAKEVDAMMRQGYRTEQSVPFCHGWLITLCIGNYPIGYCDSGDEWKRYEESDN